MGDHNNVLVAGGYEGDITCTITKKYPNWKGPTMEFEDLTPEQQASFKTCSTPEEILELAKKEGLELSEDQLDQISAGGMWDSSLKCPQCGSTEFGLDHTGTVNMVYVCKKCGCRW